MNYDKIGSFIQQKRKEKNLTQRQLAEKIGVTDRAVSKWERGLGCPDVSILEILSKELGCSILELLKGREIDGEVIPITEADDYIKEGFKISELKVKNIFNRLIEVSIIVLVLLLGYLNVVQMVYIDKKHEIYLTSTYGKMYKKQANQLDDNIEYITNHKGKYNDEDYEVIIQGLNKAYSTIQKTKIYQSVMNYEKIEYTIHDLILLNSDVNLYTNTYSIVEVLKKYDNSKLVEYYDNISIASSRYQDLSPYLTYQYRLSPNYDAGEYMYGTLDREIYDSANQVNRYLAELLYLTEIIKEVGDMYE